MKPAISGLAREVPPIRYSPYLTEPSRKVWVSPTSIPVPGSPTADTSGTTRCGDRAYRVDKDDGTTPRWYHGCGKIRLVPPPAAYR